MRLAVTAVAMALLLTACGGGREQTAAGACEAAVKAKLANRTFELSLKDLAARAKPESPDTLYLTSQIVFDKGLTSEYKQTVECRVRFENGKDPSVILLQFNWSMEDLNKNK